MALPGIVIEEIRDGLVSAFPEESKLEEMLFFKFNIPKAKILKGSTYENTVFNIVNLFESERKIISLIKEGSESVPGNYNLKKLNQQIDLISLIEKLETSKQKYLQPIQDAYKKCFPDKGEDWVSNELNDILKDFQQEYKEDYKTEFAKIFSNVISKNLAEQLKNDSSCLFDINKYKVQNKAQTENPPIATYLLIIIKLSHQSKKNYTISAWFLLKQGKNHKYESIEMDNINLANTFSLMQIKNQVVENVFQTLHDKGFNNNAKRPIIHLFLPDELMNKDFDSYEYKSEGYKRQIRWDYEIVIRSCKRVSKKYSWESVWKEKWRKLEQTNLDGIISAENRNGLLAKLRDEKNIGLKSVKKLELQDIESYIHQTGIPIAIWFRSTPQEVNCQEELDDLFQEGVCKLSQSVYKKRVETFDCSEKQHIGRHISLLWKDPNILPPDSDLQYTIPL